MPYSRTVFQRVILKQDTNEVTNYLAKQDSIGMLEENDQVPYYPGPQDYNMLT